VTSELDWRRIARGAAVTVGGPTGKNRARHYADFFDGVQSIAEEQERAGELVGASAEGPKGGTWNWRTFLRHAAEAMGEDGDPEVA
jgi:hypothetical protein